MYHSRGLAGTSRWRHLTADDLEIKGLPLQDLALSASASDLKYGVISVNLLPLIPTSKLTGNFAAGSFGMNLIPDSNQRYDIGSSNARWKDAYLASVKIASNGSITSRQGDFSIIATSNQQSLTFSETGGNVAISNANLSVSGSIQASGANLTAPLSMSSNSISMTGTIASSNARLSDIYTDDAHINDLRVDSSATFATTILPTSNGSYDIGSSSKGWRNMYADTLRLTGSLSVSGVTLSGNLDVGSNALMTSGDIGSASNRAAGVYAKMSDIDYYNVNSNLNLVAGSKTSFGTDLIPSSNSQYDIGSTSALWQDIYATNAALDGHFSVGGVVTLASNLSAAGISSSKGLTSAGTASFSSNLSVTGPIAASNILSVTGQTTLGSNLGVAGSVSAAGGLTSSNGLNVTSGTTSLGITSSNTLNVTGTATLGSNLAVTGPISASGATLSAALALGSNLLNTTGDISTSSNRAGSIYSTTENTNALTINSNLTVSAGSTTNIGTDLRPSSNIAYDIGTTSNKWRTVYASNFNAAGGTLSGDLNLNANKLLSTGDIATSNARIANAYLSLADVSYITAGNATVNGSLQCTSIDTQNSNINLGTGAIYAGSLSTSNAISGGALIVTSLSTSGGAISAGTITGTSLSAGTGSVNGGTGNFSGSVTVNGDLQVGGVLNYISSTTLQVQDKNIVLATSSNATDALASGAGLYIQGAGYSNSNNAISWTWNTGSNGNYWLPRGGNISLLGVAGSTKMVSLVTSADGSFKLLSDDGSTATSTALFGTPLLANSSNLDVGSTSNVWGTVYATTLGNSNKPITSLNATSITSGTISSGSINTNNSNISLGTGSITGGAVSGTTGSFSGGITSSNGLTVTAGSSTFSSNLAVTGPIVTAGGLTSSNGLSVTSGNAVFAGGLTSSNGLNVASGPATFASNVSISGPTSCASLTASGTGTFSSNVSITGPTSCAALTASGTGSFSSNVSITGPASVAGLLTASNGLTVSGGSVSLPSGSIAASSVGNLPASQITSGTFSVGSFGSTNISTTGTLGAGASTLGALTCTTISTGNSNITAGTGTITSGQLNPTTTATYDLGSSNTTWRNAYLSGTMTASNYVGLQRKLWNAGALGIQSIAANSYFKLATLLDSGNTASAQGLRIVGQLGGFGNTQTATVDCTIVSRGNFYVRGTIQGFISGAKQRADIVVYIETNGQYSVYYYNPAQFSVWDLSIEGGYGTILYEPTSTAITAPTGTLVTSSVLSILTTSSEFSSGTVTTSFNNFSFSNSASSGNPVWNLIGSSNSGSILSGSITSGQHNPSATATYDLGASGTAWRSAYLSSNINVGGSITGSNGLTISTGSVSLPSGSVSASAVGSLPASQITSGTFSVGSFGSTNISTTGTLGAGASTLGALTCTTISTGNSNITVGSGSITSGTGTFSSNVSITGLTTVAGLLTGSNGLTVSAGTVSLPSGSISASAIGNLPASQITSGTFSVGAFGSTNISTTGSLSAGGTTVSSLSAATGVLGQSTNNWAKRTFSITGQTLYSTPTWWKIAAFWNNGAYCSGCLTITGLLARVSGPVNFTANIGFHTQNSVWNASLVLDSPDSTDPFGSGTFDIALYIDNSKNLFVYAKQNMDYLTMSLDVTTCQFEGNVSASSIYPSTSYSLAYAATNTQLMAADTALTSVLSSSSFYTLCGSNVRKTKGSVSTFGGAVTAGSISTTGILSAGGLTCTSSAVSASGTANAVTTTDYAPSLAAGNSVVKYFGVANTTNNSAWHLFKNVGAGSTSNYAAFGIQGFGVGTGSFNASANGNFGVCTVNPTYTLDVSGTLRASSNFAVSGGTVTLPSGSVAASAIANLDASKITTGTFSVGSFGTNISTTGTLTASGAFTLPGRYYKSYTIACDTTADCAYEFASFTTGTATTLDVTIVSPKTSNIEFTKRYSITVGSSLLTADGAWRRCIPLSTHNGYPSNEDYELHVSSPGATTVTGGSQYELRLRLLHSVSTIASTITVNVTAYYAQDGLFTTSNLSSTYVEDTWRTLNYLPSTALTQTGGQVGVGTTSPSYKLDVAGSLHASGAATFDSTLTAGAVSTSGAITTTGTGTYDIGTNANKFGNLFTAYIYPTTFVTNLVPVTHNAYDVGVSGGNYWRNAYFAGTVNASTLSASTYTGLPRKYWNATTQGQYSATPGTLYKIGVLPAIGDASGGGAVRICGSMGGFGTNQSVTVDCTIASRGATNTSDLGTTSLLWKNAYHTGTHYNSGNAGFTANSTTALTTVAPFHFYGACDVNGTTAVIGVNTSGCGLVLDDVAQAKWRLGTGGYNLTFQQHTSTSATNYGNAQFTTRVYFSSNGDVNASRHVYAGSNVYASGSCYNNGNAITSDKRLKTNVRPIEGALSKICRLDGKVYDFKPHNQNMVKPNSSGFIAQEVRELFPEWIAEWDDGVTEAFPGEEPILCIDAGYGLQAYLVEAIKELRDENAALKARMTALEERCNC
ncbi:hypothetical protein KFL_008380060 [Klebsormidium nitens]|uniref:Peptidase S74 domain-containing protein n=1 Tax=Klebsormidium nitens TaxID=105231 RepID=A0A1Y1ILF7_KLENI|nr:hypothetical protein KFL_008380060 [Klebsormidium nitens]|eukprot:GAQ91715.1 hypothetical protein KFL_008380060 [Klebsormidium nitens]